MSGAGGGLFWWERIPPRELGPARPLGSGLIRPTTLGALPQIYSTPEYVGGVEDVGVTGEGPFAGDYRTNPGSSPAAPRGPVAPRAGLPSGARLAIQIGLPIVGRALGAPGFAISIISSILNRVIGPARVATGVIPGSPEVAPGTGNITPEAFAALQTAAESSTGYDPGGSLLGVLGGPYQDPASLGGQYPMDGEYNAGTLAMPGSVDTPANAEEEAPDSPLDPERDTPFTSETYLEA